MQAALCGAPSPPSPDLVFFREPTGAGATEQRTGSGEWDLHGGGGRALGMEARRQEEAGLARGHRPHLGQASGPQRTPPPGQCRGLKPQTRGSRAAEGFG